MALEHECKKVSFLLQELAVYYELLLQASNAEAKWVIDSYIVVTITWQYSEANPEWRMEKHAESSTPESIDYRISLRRGQGETVVNEAPNQQNVEHGGKTTGSMLLIERDSLLHF